MGNIYDSGAVQERSWIHEGLRAHHGVELENQCVLLLGNHIMNNKVFELKFIIGTNQY